MTAAKLGCEHWWVRNVIHGAEAVEGEGSSSFGFVGFSWLIVTGKSERYHDYFLFLS